MANDTLRVSGIQIGNAEFKVEGSEGMSLKQVGEKFGVRLEGTTWIVNGDRVAHGDVASTRVTGGDSVVAAPKAEGGLLLVLLGA